MSEVIDFPSLPDFPDLIKNRYFILDLDKNPVATTFLAYTLWESKQKTRHVGDTRINGCRVSTVFLGVNHNWSGGPPVLFETMIFTRRCGSYRTLDQIQRRYCTWQQAQTGHDEIVRAVKHKNLTFLKNGLHEI